MQRLQREVPGTLSVSIPELCAAYIFGNNGGEPEDIYFTK